MNSKTGHKIKKRTHANDIFITPLKLAKLCIDRHSYIDTDIWLDSCRNNGSFYNQFPNDNKDWCEILDNKDFLSYNKKVDIISQNPPYSMLSKWIDKCIEISRKEIGMLIGIHNLTPKRIETFNNAGFFVKSYIIFKVYQWYGYSCYVIFSKEITKNSIDFNRTIWR